jgi:predicted MFS family arabinose efflux permease
VTEVGARSDWQPVAAYAALSAANQMLWLTYTPLTTDAARHYGVSSGAIGWLAEIFPLVYVVLAVPTGSLIDREMHRWVAVGATLTAVGALLRLVGDAYFGVLAGQLLLDHPAVAFGGLAVMLAAGLPLLRSLRSVAV